MRFILPLLLFLTLIGSGIFTPSSTHAATTTTVATKAVSQLPTALIPRKGVPHPVQTVKGTFNPRTVTAEKYLVVDPSS